MAKYQSAALTDVGQKRDHNEDSHLVDDGLGLYIVCDGMGGHAGGETASRLAVESIAAQVKDAAAVADGPFTSDAPLSSTPLAGLLRSAVENACLAIYTTATGNPDLKGMGTTCIALLVQRDQAIVAHVGDSRAYLCRGDQIIQLSEDHSLVNEQVRAGLLTPEEARHSRYRNIITRSVGFERDVLVDLIGLATLPGDRFLLCSDGLNNLVDNEEMGRILREHTLDEAPKLLVEMANARGGDDNITVVVVSRSE